MGNIGKNSAIYMIRNVMNVLFPLLTFKYASQTIGPEGVGAANYAAAIVGYFGLIAQLGINTYAMAEGARIRKNPNKLKEFVDCIFTINTLSTAVAYALLFSFLIIMPRLAGYRILIVVYSASIILSTIGMEWLFVVKEKFSYITVRSILIQLLAFVFLVLFVKDENDVTIYAALSVLATSASGILNFIYANRLCAIRFVSFKRCVCHIKPVMTIWIANIASLIYVNADIMIIGTLLGDKQVGIYSAATKIVKAVCIPIGTISTVTGPMLAEAIGTDNKVKITEITRKVIKRLSFFIFPCIMGLCCLSEEAILFVSGKAFLGAVAAERIMLLDIFISPLNGFIANQILVPAHKERASMKAMIAAAIANIGLDILLIPRMGINGAAIATVVAELTVLIFCTIQARGIANLALASKAGLRFALASLIIPPVSMLVKQCVKIWYARIIVVVVIAGGAYLIFATILEKIDSRRKDDVQ